jgi:processive 1,2-diacylglycerol beta-glucosyltransferase
MSKIVLVYFGAGGGHRAATRALADAIQEQGRPWEVEALNLDDALESIDPVHRISNVHGGELYNWSLRNGWTAGSSGVIPMMHGLIRLLHDRQVALLTECWRRLRPDLVVSLVPHFNRALFESLRLVAPRAPYATVLTDIADYPPHFWLERQDQHVICGSERAVQQALALGVDRRWIWRVSGMIVHPRFYRPMRGDRRQARRALGLNPDLSTGLVMFGGNGSQTMFSIARNAAKSAFAGQLIFLCGGNRELKSQLQQLLLPYPMHAEGFTNDVAWYMWLSDFFVGKPGPGSVSEALAMRLPVIVESGIKTLAQERYNVDWIREMGVGVAVSSARAIPGAMRTLMQGEARQRALERIESLNNRAVFEIPVILDHLLAEAACAPGKVNWETGPAGLPAGWARPESA